MVHWQKHAHERTVHGKRVGKPKMRGFAKLLKEFCDALRVALDHPSQHFVAHAIHDARFVHADAIDVVDLGRDLERSPAPLSKGAVDSAPLISRHRNVEFHGEVNEAQKAEFLGNALALLFPIDWPEPFGLVMIESPACAAT
jgi:glycosyltransferase involved in cell wall biosynthesis